MLPGALQYRAELLGRIVHYYNPVDTVANLSTPVTAPAATLRPQPYLIYYVEKLMELMGYSIKENVMKDGKTDRLICVNGMDTNLYADLLPDWTVDEFITQIERLFNLIFVVGNNGNEVSIVRSTDYYAKREPVPAEIYLRKDGEVYSFCVPFSRKVIEVNGPQNPENKIKEPGLVDVIQNGIQKKQAPNCLFIAYYDGYQEFFLGFNPQTGEAVCSGKQLRIPMCYTIPFEHGIYSIGDTGIYCVWPDKRVTLAINGEYGLYNTLNKTNQKVNTSQRITISFLRHGRMFNPLDTYIIAHKKYFCEELKYKFNEQGLSDVVEGTFLLM